MEKDMEPNGAELPVPPKDGLPHHISEYIKELDEEIRKLRTQAKIYEERS